ncbi:Zinc ion binding, putative isoform 1 [Hibiscus syriacus]|uniref:Zinc ion binding, putative isoform 1 n=1 Tax=Hibiscus syriacus TaxID=106335 RepID=A0A6A2YG54_HIBSY|nr:formin-like protein 5 [Hibiscus syriacus]KAE8675959.1 Zinc ion binding, putative isoform 1 [Hibiscus syriacus]
MEVTRDPPPLWPQLPTFVSRRRPPSLIFSLPVLIILLPILALLLLFLVVPPFLSVAAQILRPLGIRKSWDSLNVFLVLSAIICGVLARRNDDYESNNGNGIRNYNISDDRKASGRHVHVSQQWFEHQERKTYDGGAPINMRPFPATCVRRLKRSSSSYPDLRLDSLWENNEDRFRFFDDFEINKYRSSTSSDDQVHELRRSWRSGFEESEAKVIPVDTFVLRSSPSSSPSKSPPPSTPPPPPLTPPVSRHKPKRSYQAVGQKDHKVMDQNDRVDFNEIKSPSVTPPPPSPQPPRRPPPPLVQVGNRSEQKYGKLERRKSTATKEINMVFASLRKRKRKHKSQDHDHQQDYPLHSPTEPPPCYSTSIQPTSPAPPPPPPPPPPTFFQKYNLFRKGSKSKKIHSVPTPPPPSPTAAFSFSKRSSKQNIQIPPTPPPAPTPATFYTKRLSTQNNQIPPPEPSTTRTTANNGKPQMPTKANTISYYDENVNSGGQSPLIPMPPPPPPFKMPDFKLVIGGDFVKIRSSPSSRCSSPDLEEIDVPSSKDETETASMMESDDGVGVAGVPVCCPSPDVNAKAETFIARLRDGWELEKINSIKEKQRI